MRKNLPLIIGLAIPVLMILFVVSAIYVPNLFSHPKYDFVFTVGDYTNYYSNYYDYGDHYSVKDGVIVKTTVPYPQTTTNTQKPVPPQPVRKVGLFLFDVQSNTVKTLSYEDAQKLKIDISPTSPDGYVLERGGGDNGIFELFGSSRNYSSWFLKKGLISKKIYLTPADSSYYGYNESQFLGWVINK